MNKKIRRIVTGHSEDGTANFVSDEKFTTVEIPSGDAAFSLIWTTYSVPADLNDPTDRPDDKTYEPLEIEFGNHENIFDSSDKIALITGASSGMGKVIVEALT